MRLHPRFRLRTCLPVIAVLLACVPVLSAPGTAAVSWLPVVEIAGGGGTKGPWRQNDSHYDYVDDGSVAFMHDGNLAVAWADQRRKDVRLQVLGADGRARTASVDVSRSPATFSWMPRLAAGGPDTLYVLWQEIIFSGGSHGGDILFARSLDAGRSFSPPINLQLGACGMRRTCAICSCQEERDPFSRAQGSFADPFPAAQSGFFERVPGNAAAHGRGPASTEQPLFDSEEQHLLT